MKTELLKIAQDLERGTITEHEAQSLLLGLLGVSERFSKEDIKNLVYEFREERLEGWDEPYHYNAECWSGMKGFIKWLNAR